MLLDKTLDNKYGSMSLSADISSSDWISEADAKLICQDAVNEKVIYPNAAVKRRDFVILIDEVRLALMFVILQQLPMKTVLCLAGYGNVHSDGLHDGPHSEASIREV